MKNRLVMDTPTDNFLPPRSGGDGGSPSSEPERDDAFHILSTHVYV
jgi:hypothetical protein